MRLARESRPRAMQIDLFSSSAPSVSPSDLASVIRCLQGSGWRTGKQLSAITGWSDRKLRAIAHASKGQIVGGNKGYALVREISDADADEIEGRLLSQARQMTDRVREIRIARNRRESSAA